MTDAVLSSSLPNSRCRAATNPWVVAAVVVVPTFMEVLDTTIAVVALRYIAAGPSDLPRSGRRNYGPGQRHG